MLIISIKQIIIIGNFNFNRKPLIHFRKFNENITCIDFLKIKNKLKLKKELRKPI